MLSMWADMLTLKELQYKQKILKTFRKLLKMATFPTGMFI